jgi:hypothetical protein
MAHPHHPKLHGRLKLRGLRFQASLGKTLFVFSLEHACFIFVIQIVRISQILKFHFPFKLFFLFVNFTTQAFKRRHATLSTLRLEISSARLDVVARAYNSNHKGGRR